MPGPAIVRSDRNLATSLTLDLFRRISGNVNQALLLMPEHYLEVDGT